MKNVLATSGRPCMDGGSMANRVIAEKLPDDTRRIKSKRRVNRH